MITDPRFAPRRDDLPYLRRRSRSDAVRPRADERPRAETTTAAAADAPSSGPISFARPDRRRVPAAPRPAAAESVPPPPPPPPPPGPGPAPAGSLLDLDGPGTLPPALTPPGSLLDLGTAPAREPAVRAAAAPAPAPASTPTAHVAARVHPGERLILSDAEPTVTLTRLQSGIGTLHIEAACSAQVGDLRLGAAYQLRSGLTSTVHSAGGERHAPPASRRPVIVAGRARFEQLQIDLRQSRDLQRLVVYGFSEGRAPLQWGGILVVETFGGARVEVPLERLSAHTSTGGQVAVLLSLYNIAGEFVLRAESQVLAGDIREAARAYGFDRISWLDDRTPIQ